MIIHGSYGRPEGNWFPWLKQEVENAGHEAVVPQFPTPDGQKFSAWRKVFEEQVGQLDHEMILVGHSVGAGFVLRMLDEANDHPVKAAFLVAGFLGKLGLPDYDGINETFVSRKFDWTRIKRNAGGIFVMHGEGDPYVPLEKGQELASKLSVPMMLIPRGGHLSEESGFISFPLLFEKIHHLLK